MFCLKGAPAKSLKTLEDEPFFVNLSSMSSATEEIIRVCEALPPEKQDEVADFARFLLVPQDDEAWERILADQRPRPRLEAFLRDASANGDQPLDLDRL